MGALAVILEWLLKPAVGALGLWLFGYARAEYLDRKIRKQYSLAGKYIAYAEGVRDGHKVIDKELVELRQRILAFNGLSRSIDRKRQWVLEGEIVDNSCLSGTYRSQLPTDKSRGTFFLEPKQQGEYDGVWAGYDIDSRKVTSGSYHLRKLMEPSIMLLKDTTVIDPALAILTVNLGQRYIDALTFRDFLDGKDTRFALGAFINGDLAGVALANELKAQDLAYYESAARNANLRMPIAAFRRVGHLKSIAIKDAYRQLGIGTLLCLETIRRLKEAGCTAVFTVGWDSGLPSSAMGLFPTIGFERVGEIKDFWKVNDINDDHQCPKCGFPCGCTAVFFLLRRL